MQIDTSDTPYLLVQWGLWARSSDLRLWYPGTNILAEMAGSKRKGRAHMICDADACAVDRALARLHHRDREMGDATALYFITGLNYAAVCRRLSIHRGRAVTLVTAGTGWVEHYLHVANNQQGKDKQ